MACDDTNSDGCDPGQYLCTSCNASKVCKRCPDAIVLVPEGPPGPPADPRWAWCAGKGTNALCVPMDAFTTKQEADAWFAAQGRPERVGLKVVDIPDLVTWGEP